MATYIHGVSVSITQTVQGTWIRGNKALWRHKRRVRAFLVLQLQIDGREMTFPCKLRHMGVTRTLGGWFSSIKDLIHGSESNHLNGIDTVFRSDKVFN